MPPYDGLASQLPSPPSVGIARDTRLRVALLWAVSDWDTSRSIDLADLHEVLRTPGVEFFSLQQGRAARDPRLESFGITPLSARTEAIEDAASAISQMDLVISVDGMPAHLAATLGTPTWLMLKHEADWRWMTGRSDSPWYPAMRLIRQPCTGDWRAVAHDVAHALKAQCGR